MKPTLVLGLLALASAAAPSLAQGEGRELPLPQQPTDREAEELIRLFHEVEAALTAVDERLLRAGAGEGLLEAPDDAGLEKLLREAQDSSRSVIAGIDRILEVAQSMSPSGGGSGSSESESSGASPLDAERDRGPSARERTPEAPAPKARPDGSQPNPDSNEPSPKERQGPSPRDPLQGENRPGQPRTEASGPGQPRLDDAERWGELPPRVRETFRSQGSRELPPQYRDWIDAYYRRLSQRP